MTTRSTIEQKTILNFSTNENPYGPSPTIQKKAWHYLDRAHRYTESSYATLKCTLADFLGVRTDRIVIGNGSEYILELIIKQFLYPSHSAIISQYTFITIAQLLIQYHIPTYTVPACNYAHDLTAIAANVQADTRIIFLVNPNNPTGTYFTAHDFAQFMQYIPQHVLVVVDEAYYEYMTTHPFYPDSLSLLNLHANLIIVRTFSKAYGLAGFRLGYAITSSALAAQLEKGRLPYAVNTLIANVADAALNDQAHLKKVVMLTDQGRIQLALGLSKLAFRFLGTAGNFISIDTKDATNASQHLQQEGILVKPLHAYDMPNFIRITIGTKAQNDFFLFSLEKVAPHMTLL